MSGRTRSFSPGSCRPHPAPRSHRPSRAFCPQRERRPAWRKSPPLRPCTWKLHADGRLVFSALSIECYKARNPPVTGGFLPRFSGNDKFNSRTLIQGFMRPVVSLLPTIPKRCSGRRARIWPLSASREHARLCPSHGRCVANFCFCMPLPETTKHLRRSLVVHRVKFRYLDFIFKKYA